MGRCANSGRSLIRVHPAGSDIVIEEQIMMVVAHPGIFAIGDAPSGDHVDGFDSTVRSSLSSCNQLLPAQPNVCRARTSGRPARLEVQLTGAEAFLCTPCTPGALVFELAPVAGGAYVPQQLTSLVKLGEGLELATITLRPDTAAGAYLFRVRIPNQPEIPPPTRVELGQPT